MSTSDLESSIPYNFSELADNTAKPCASLACGHTQQVHFQPLP
eukprot:CAMPEP_0172812842 /NCGR_PEP_ID=MMETSP1075-20121228/10290_1 /TAXON_ID=2916 /ORGANISM="Ceratium fusus, Strain PA161109" /LENGTH=42 /DNA_ID= /DNA_START= /DNA_END= /DNA_ORIENTATION=